jgi:ureidoglycolate lyase
MLDQPAHPCTYIDSSSREPAAIHVHTEASRDEFAPFGLMLRGPDLAGQRADYSTVFLSADPDSRPRLHINCVEASTLPLSISSVERHPRSWQTFIPLDVSRFVVCVMGSNPAGEPDLGAVHFWILDGNVGVSFAPGVWHAGATVLDRKGNFAVVWPRADTDRDTEFFTFQVPVKLV